MYAEKTGVGSVLSPRDMMIPSGSDGVVSLRSFFIALSLYDWHTRVAARLKAPDMPFLGMFASLCELTTCTAQSDVLVARVSQNDTPLEDTSVVMTLPRCSPSSLAPRPSSLSAGDLSREETLRRPRVFFDRDRPAFVLAPKLGHGQSTLASNDRPDEMDSAIPSRSL